MGSFWTKFVMFELKKIMFDDTEDLKKKWLVFY